MTAAVCGPFLIYHPMFSPQLMILYVRGASGGFTRKIVRPRSPSVPRHLIYYCFFLVPRDAAVSASAWVSSHPSSSFAVRDNTPRLCLPSTFFHTRHRTGVAYRSLDRFRCGRRVCRLRSVLQPSTHRWRARGPAAPTRRVEIVSTPHPPTLPHSSPSVE